LFFFIGACIDPLNVEVSETTRRLVVDGLITDQPGPHIVKLFYSNPLSTSRLRPFDPVSGATVSIVDDLGVSNTLMETSPGIYETKSDEFSAQIGRSYYLFIRTAAGEEYSSDMQQLKASGEIDDLYLDFQKGQLRDNDLMVDGLGIYIDARGALAEENFFRWRWKTIHMTRSFPERKVTPTPGGDIPTPEPCSGVTYSRGQFTRVGECTCCYCWSYNYSENTYVSQNDFVSKNTFNKQFLGFIPATAMHFFDRYYIDVQQLSLSEEAYVFWGLVEKQQKGSTDLFQPNAIKIKGNIKSLTNADEEVLGFFGVSGLASKSMFIDPSEIPYSLPAIDTIPFSCLDYFKNPTTDKPFFW
jgi:hypothetical protein